MSSTLKLPIYMDSHATTPVDPRVLEAMLPYFKERFGNAASNTHGFGWAAAEAVKISRETIASVMGANDNEIVFTSGATESNNLAITGAAESYAHKGRHIISVVTEHSSVLDTCRSLERKGYQITFLQVKEDGRIDLDQLGATLTEETILVSVMHANNEIGVIQDIEAIGTICHERGVLFHTDATQSFGKIYFNVIAQHVDIASVSGHKIYGPKGVGALYVRGSNPQVRLSEQIHGGKHERGLRSGTLNVPGIVGLAAAARIASEDMIDDALRTGRLRNMLLSSLRKNVGEIVVNGPDPAIHPEHRLTGNLNVCFSGIDATALMMGVKDVAVSAGSACASGHTEASHVLRALPSGEERSKSSIRFGLGRFTTEEEIEYTIEHFSAEARKLLEFKKVFSAEKERVGKNNNS